MLMELGNFVFVVFSIQLVASAAATKYHISKRQATDGFRSRALELHNEYRAKHGSPPLDFDEKMNEAAQSHAIRESRSNKGQSHDGDSWRNYGENLAYRGVTNPLLLPMGGAAAEWACAKWYDENSSYNFTNPDIMKLRDWGEFTAMIWKSTRKLGMGISYGAKINSSGKKLMTFYIVARYFPPGNVLDLEQLKRNVQPPRK